MVITSYLITESEGFPGKPGWRIEDGGSRIEDRVKKQTKSCSAKCARYRGRIDQNKIF